MATIRNTITLADKMSPVFTKMAKAMTSNLRLMENVNKASKKGVDNKAFDRAKADVEAANNAVKMFNNSLRKTKHNSDEIKGVFDRIKNQLANIYAGTQLVKQGYQMLNGSADYLDDLASKKARTNLVNDGSQTTSQLQDKMASSAINSRADYSAFSDSVIKLNMLAPDSFKTNDEAIGFMETMNKMFVVSGASAQESTNAMYQLNQAMASGRLQGDEFRSIIENAPMLANVISESMGVSRAELKELSSDGAITADVIKKAVFDSADEINEKFASMPITFGQMATNLKTITSRAMQGVSDAFSNLISSEAGQSIFNGLVQGITIASNVMQGFMKISAIVIDALNDGWTVIGPIIGGVLITLGGHFLTVGANAMIAGIKVAWSWAMAHGQLLLVAGIAAAVIFALNSMGDAGRYLAIGIMVLVGAYAVWIIAQKILNAGLMACPITWILVAIVAIVVIIYLIVDAINDLTGSSVSATGVIFGCFASVGAFIGNIFIGLYNMCVEVVGAVWDILAAFGNFFGNFLDNPVAAIVHLIADLVNSALGLLKSLAEVIDAIFGSSLADAVTGWQDKINEWAVDLVGEQKVYVEKFDSSKYKLDSIDYGDAWDAGYKLGEDLENSFGSFDPSDILDQSGDILDGLQHMSPDGGKLDSVGKINDDVTIAEEDIKLLKDIATTKFVNKYSTLQPNLTVQFGDVYESGDIDRNKIMEIVDEMATEAFAVAVVREA